MKMKYICVLTVLTIALTINLFGQNKHHNKTKMEMRQHEMLKMMGKPTAVAKVEGLKLKVWITTQEQHKKMMEDKMGKMMKHDKMERMKDSSMEMGKDMNGMNHGGMKMDKAAKDAMMSGTHHLILNITDAASGKVISDASSEVLIESPSKKNSTVLLLNVMSCYGNGLILDEKGEYALMIHVNINGATKMKTFLYKVK